MAVASSRWMGGGGRWRLCALRRHGLMDNNLRYSTDSMEDVRTLGGPRVGDWETRATANADKQCLWDAFAGRVM